MEAQLEVLCKDAGEKIQRSVDNVEGLYVHFPKEWMGGLRYYHEDDRFVHSFLNPQMGRHYTFVEMDSPRKVGMIDHSQVGTPMKQIAEPEARYEITWKSLTDKQDLRHGLYGDELTILDFQTKEVLASRKFFFYVVQDGTIDRAGQALRTPGLNTPYRFATCKNYNPGYDDRYIDKRPRDSYRFVAKVLRPKVMPSELAAHVFDLARGSGQKRKDCGISVRLGPGIVATDLRLSQVDPVSLRITLKGTDDSLVCGGLWGNSVERSVVMFYDGSRMKLADLLKATDRDSSLGSVGTR
jgi:hypothetical protein